MGSAASKPSRTLPRTAKQAAEAGSQAASQARSAPLPAAEGARPEPIHHEPPPAEAAQHAQPAQSSTSSTAHNRLHAAEYQDDAIIRDGSDPQMASAPESHYASQLAALGPVDVNKPRLRLARNDRMLEILAGRERENYLNPQEQAAAQLRGHHLPRRTGQSVPSGSRSTRDTRLASSTLTDLLAARTQATHQRHIAALAREFGLDEHTVEALGRRFGAPLIMEQTESQVASLPPKRTPSQPRLVDSRNDQYAPDDDVVFETGPDGRERSDAQIHELLRDEDVGPEGPDQPQANEHVRKYLVWADVPEVDRSQP